MTPDDETSNWQKRLDRLADERQREATAATLLAAIVSPTDENSAEWTHDMEPRLLELNYSVKLRIKYAVALTDALRAALAVRP